MHRICVPVGTDTACSGTATAYRVCSRATGIASRTTDMADLVAPRTESGALSRALLQMGRTARDTAELQGVVIIGSGLDLWAPPLPLLYCRHSCYCWLDSLQCWCTGCGCFRAVAVADRSTVALLPTAYDRRRRKHSSIPEVRGEAATVVVSLHQSFLTLTHTLRNGSDQETAVCTILCVC